MQGPEVSRKVSQIMSIRMIHKVKQNVHKSLWKDYGIYTSNTVVQ